MSTNLARRLLRDPIAAIHIRRQRLQRHLWQYVEALEKELAELKEKQH